MTNIAIVLEWKHPGLEGIRTKNGVCMAFPGGIPSQADQDTWTAEYEVWKTAQDQAALANISFDDFESRFTGAEWDDATDFVYQSDPTTGKPMRRALVQGLARAQARNNVDLSHAKTDAFLSIMVSGGVITEQRKTQILTP